MTEGSAGRLPVVLLWHMHQPHYRDALSGEYVLPWTYLHGLKDYSDMAAHLEANRDARAVFNVTPVLIQQLRDYVAMLKNHRDLGVALADPVLALLSEIPLPLDATARATVVAACLRAQRQRMIERYPAYQRLADLPVEDFDDCDLRDLGVWYHLAWCGEALRREHPVVRRLLAKERNFDHRDRAELLAVISETLAGILPRWRALADRGQLELSVSPCTHPILPLLQDFGAAREARPQAPLPKHPGYPGGTARAAWQVAEGLRLFEQEFGRRPQGCWPSEGAVSRFTADLLAAQGFGWAASGGAVLRASLDDGLADHGDAAFNQAWRLPTSPLHLFFRHDRLSDLVGFEYSRWHGDDAARHLASELQALADGYRGQSGRCVLIALDGENAWEHFPDNGWWFLTALYRELASHPRLELTTLGEFRSRNVQPATLARLTAGSWVHGSLDTWMGDPDKNRAWDLLCDAKVCFDARMAQGNWLDAERVAAEQQLAICESSDWFWWFGDYNPSEAVASFDRLYRRQLAVLYRMLGQVPPAVLEQPLSRGGGKAEGGGSMRRADDA